MGSMGGKPNGYRRNCKPTDLLPLEAPIQPRKYNGSSATSRKEIPTSVVKSFHGTPTTPNKRSSDQAGLHDSSSSDDRVPGSAQSSTMALETEGMDPDDALQAHIKEKRRLNTLAARKTRQRKAQYADDMKKEVDRLVVENAELSEQLEMFRKQAQEVEHWKKRALQAEGMLSGLPMGMRF